MSITPGRRISNQWAKRKPRRALPFNRNINIPYHQFAAYHLGSCPYCRQEIRGRDAVKVTGEVRVHESCHDGARALGFEIKVNLPDIASIIDWDELLWSIEVDQASFGALEDLMADIRAIQSRDWEYKFRFVRRADVERFAD